MLLLRIAATDGIARGTATHCPTPGPSTSIPCCPTGRIFTALASLSLGGRTTRGMRYKNYTFVNSEREWPGSRGLAERG